MRNEQAGFLNVGVLTGVAIDEHVVLTAGHAFLYEPEIEHPLKINRQPVEYQIIADGLRGHRLKFVPNGKNIADKSFINQDFLLLRTDISFRITPILSPRGSIQSRNIFIE
ncbi:MAG: hypothetical protein R3B67_09040 [Phycisphaerales bacterium]